MNELDIMLAALQNPYTAIIATVFTILTMLLRWWIKKQQAKEAFDKQIIEAQQSIGKASIELSEEMKDTTARMDSTRQSDIDRLKELIK